MSKLGRVGVVAVTYDSAADVDGLLSSLHAASATVDLRVVVADNASSDDTVARLRAAEIPVDVVEMGANRGYAAGINAAAARVPADLPLLVLNPDVRLSADALAPLVAATTDPTVGIVAPRLVDAQGRTLPSLRRDPAVRRALAEALLGGRRASRHGWGEVVTNGTTYAQPCDVDWASGAALLVTPTCRRVVGAWDESFFLYSEETDYLTRARDAGLRVRYEPDAVVHHRGGAAHTDPRLWSILTVNRVRCFRRRHRGLHGLAFYLAALLNELLRAPRSRPHRRAAAELVRRGPALLGGRAS